MKSLEDQGAIISRPIKRGSSFFLSISLQEPTGNTINTTSTVSHPSNTPVCANYDTVSE